MRGAARWPEHVGSCHVRLPVAVQPRSRKVHDHARPGARAGHVSDQSMSGSGESHGFRRTRADIRVAARTGSPGMKSTGSWPCRGPTGAQRLCRVSRKEHGCSPRSIHRKRAALAVLVVAALSAVVAVAHGARQRDRRGGAFAPRLTGRADSPAHDAAFRFCRLPFRPAPNGDGHGWDVDYPRADVNLSLRLSQLTKTPVTLDVEGNPTHIVVRLTDPELFRCPFVMMTEPGGTYFSEQEAAQLRIYLLKGGFLWADDFWGSYAWRWWTNQIGKALPPTEYPIVDLSKDHPLYHTFFDIDHVPQIPNIGLWLSARITSERGADSAQPHARAILDRAGRVIV